MQQIETRILQNTFEDVTNVTAILRELMQIKKFILNHSHNIKSLDGKYLIFSDHFNQVVKQIDQLKRLLIRTSHQTEKSTEPRNDLSLKPDNSYRRLFNQLGKEHDMPLLLPNFKGKLYWKLDKSQIDQSYPSPVFSKQHQLMFVSTTCHHLAELLSTKGMETLFKNKDIYVSDKNFSRNFDLACGVCLKVTPELKALIKRERRKLGCWQSESSNMGSKVLLRFANINLQNYISEIFFRSKQEYLDFKQFLSSNQDTDLLTKLDLYDQRQQIYIYNQTGALKNIPINGK